MTVRRIKKYSKKYFLLSSVVLNCYSLMVLASPDAAADAKQDFFSPWDLALILPNTSSEIDLKDLLSISDLGYSKAEIKAMIDHISQKFVLPESLKADDDSLSDKINLKKILGGPLNDRVLHNSDGSTNLRVVDSEGKDALNCFLDGNSWKAEQMRIAPYKIQAAGTPSVYANWAESKGKAIDSIMQVRIAFRPYCLTSKNEMKALDQAIHFAFELKPSDAKLGNLSDFKDLLKNPSALTGSVWGKSSDFANASRQGNNKKGAMDALASHLEALNSEDYLKFRSYVLQDLSKFSAIRNKLQQDSFKDINAITDELRKNLLFSSSLMAGNGQQSLAHPGFKSNFRRELLDQFKAFAIKYATRGNVTAIAGFFTDNGQKSYYSNFGMGAYNNQNGLKEPEAKTDYSLIHPNSMSTTTAELQDNGGFIKLASGKTSDFYAQADAIGVEKIGFAFRLINPGEANPARINEVDFYSKNSVQKTTNTDQKIVFSKTFPTQGSDLFLELQKYSNPNKTLPSSTSCVSCHALPRSGLNGASSDSAQMQEKQKFILLDEFSITSRTVQELDREVAKLNVEWQKQK